jgi:hypothetical protein
MATPPRCYQGGSRRRPGVHLWGTQPCQKLRTVGWELDLVSSRTDLCVKYLDIEAVCPSVSVGRFAGGRYMETVGWVSYARFSSHHMVNRHWLISDGSDSTERT